MGVIRERLKGKRKLLVLLLPLALLLPVLATAATGSGDLIVVANAPDKGSDMTVFLAVDAGPFGNCYGKASVEIELGGVVVLPAIYNVMPVENCRGTLSIPYARFAAENAVYLVRVEFDGEIAETRVAVQKHVEWLFVRAFPYPEDQQVRVDFAFDRAIGQPLVSSVFATGKLVMDVAWEECTAEPLPAPLPELPSLLPDPCKASGQNVFHGVVDVFDEASTHVFIPFSSLRTNDFTDPDRPDEGWYNVTATFHNDEAMGNYNVPMDPTVLREEPPGNWFEVSDE